MEKNPRWQACFARKTGGVEHLTAKKKGKPGPTGNDCDFYRLCDMMNSGTGFVPRRLEMARNGKETGIRNGIVTPRGKVNLHCVPGNEAVRYHG